MRKSKTKDSKYPEDDRDLKVYEDWEAGPAHYDFRNKKRFDNRSVKEREGYRHPTLSALLIGQSLEAGLLEVSRMLNKRRLSSECE